MIIKKYVYNGFSHVNLDFYQAINSIINNKNDFDKKIDLLINGLAVKMNLNPQNENDGIYPYNMVLLFLSDYLTTAELNLYKKTDDLVNVRQFLSINSNDKYFRIGQNIISWSILISLANKVFLSCLPKSEISDQKFYFILKNFESMYQFILRNHHNYIFADDLGRVNKLCNNLKLMLGDLKDKDNTPVKIKNERLQLFEQKLYNLRNIKNRSYLRWLIFGTLGSLGILGSLWFARRYPEKTEQIPVFRLLFGQNNIFRQIFEKIKAAKK